MSKTHTGEPLIAITSIASASISGIFLHAIGVIISALLGAIVAWSFNRFIRPRLDAYIDKKRGKAQ